MNALEIMDASGHITLAWDPHNAKEVKAAEVEFERLKGCGFAFFWQDEQVDALTGPGQLDVRPVLTKEFKARGRTVAVRPMRGG